MIIEDLLKILRHDPKAIEFNQVMQVIHQFYVYTATDFSNGKLLNLAGTNEGSCKIFYFAQLHGLNKTETLGLFGSFYRDDVLTNPTGNDHGNIRTFMLLGWAGIKFDNVALTKSMDIE